MKWLLPRSLPAWVLLIVIAGLLAIQVSTLSIVSRERVASNTILDLFRLNDRALSLVKLMYAASPEERKHVAAGLSVAPYVLSISDTPAITSSIPADDEMAELEDVIVGRLTKFGVEEARVRRESAQAQEHPKHKVTEPDDNLGGIERELLDLSADFNKTDTLVASIEFKDGQWLNFVMPSTPLSPILTTDSLPLYGSVAALVVLLSIWSLRRLTAPYRALESAVRRIGDDLKSPPLAERGSSEYKSAARAVNTMQARLREYVEDRELLAAALAHDLRTPLTRIRLRLELLRNSPLRTALMQNLADIEAISSSVLDFATYEAKGEEPERIDFWSLVDSVADGNPQVVFDGSRKHARGLVCYGRTVALRRCVTNLVDNAVKYGGKARLVLSQNETEILLTIDDDGPGIPEGQMEKIFRPFARVEASRNRQTGGFGLGLTIARNIARRFGGDVRLHNRTGGGLRAELTIPLAKGAQLHAAQ
ncbi:MULTISPECIES: ATP-binding protein [unclassified Mesorhizobium]|jgi:signal transduction histidine kinase|uniref:ATP-binding protein n=1 Tax=unclassified Mesorhizobium TaxID=325217 RepID=UPI0008F0075E|nr:MULTISPECIES: ATP-binding protein [unclassified Mesorhizobium]RJG44051.1 HAMP domain-containing protein [Mesorhizobium sp. DCY119]SFU06323.1 Signal transduction histidine kinase [Mesorhizobium sp. YR577]